MYGPVVRLGVAGADGKAVYMKLWMGGAVVRLQGVWDSETLALEDFVIADHQDSVRRLDKAWRKIAGE